MAGRHFAWGEKELHRLVCDGRISLADAQKCIASDWVKCWEKYVVPEYGPEWAAANRHEWWVRLRCRCTRISTCVEWGSVWTQR
jgi:hypothetical protein